MQTSTLLSDSLDRVAETARHVVDGLDADQLAFRVDAEANTIAWLLWHLTRVEDDHLVDLEGGEQTWTRDGFAGRFALPFGDSATGYGQSTDEVAAVRVEGQLLLEYLEAVTERSKQFLATLTDDDLDRVIDTSWDPPVTLGVRVVSVINDATQHIGQASFVRGVLDRR